MKHDLFRGKIQDFRPIAYVTKSGKMWQKMEI